MPSKMRSVLLGAIAQDDDWTAPGCAWKAMKRWRRWCRFDKARLVKGSAPGSWLAQFWEDSWKLEELAHEWLPNFSGDGVGDGAMETQIMSDNLWLTSTEYFPQKWSSFIWKSPCRLTDDMEYGLPSSPVVCSFERHAVSLFGRSLSRYAYYQHTLYVWTSGSMM